MSPGARRSFRRGARRVVAACGLAGVIVGAPCASAAEAGARSSLPPAALATYRVEGDGIPQSLTGRPGDVARGREIALGRDANCVLCHPVPDAKFSGNLGPPLAGTGSRWSAAQFRLRLVEPARLNPETIMPAYHRVDGLRQVAAAFAGKPILDAQQIEDVIAYLQTLK